MSPIQEEKVYNTISENLLNACDYFINLCDFSEKEILGISVLKEPRENRT